MHKHLTWTDRLKIEKGLKEGLKPCAIADRLHVHNTTIYRELKRGRYTHLNSDLTTEERYSPEIAQQRYEENLKAKGGELKIGNDYELSAFIEKDVYKRQRVLRVRLSCSSVRLRRGSRSLLGRLQEGLREPCRKYRREERLRHRHEQLQI